eukprot:693923-Amphidinium_carterae.2
MQEVRLWIAAVLEYTLVSSVSVLESGTFKPQSVCVSLFWKTKVLQHWLNDTIAEREHKPFREQQSNITMTA